MRHIVYGVETEVETDGRWIAEIPDLPGVLAYGSTEKEAVASAQALALCVLADRSFRHPTWDFARPKGGGRRAF